MKRQYLVVVFLGIQTASGVGAQPLPSEEAKTALSADPVTPRWQIYDRTQAAQEYERGNVALDVGRFAEAIEHFQRSLQWAPDAALVYYNAGLAWSGLNQCGPAGFYFRAYGELSPAGKYAEASREKIRDCGNTEPPAPSNLGPGSPPALGILHLAVSGLEAIRLDQELVALPTAELDLVVSVGRHSIGPGHAPNEPTVGADVQLGRRSTVVLVAAGREPAHPKAEFGPQPAVGQASHRRVALYHAGAGALLAGLGLAADLAARNTDTRMNKEDNTTIRYRDLRDQFHQERTAALIGYGIGTALLIYGAVSWFKADPVPAQTSTTQGWPAERSW